jgi:hypothetical protein
MGQHREIDRRELSFALNRDRINYGRLAGPRPDATPHDEFGIKKFRELIAYRIGRQSHCSGKLLDSAWPLSEGSENAQR